MSPTETMEIERLLHLAQYRAAWQRLEAAMQAAQALMHEVQLYRTFVSPTSSAKVRVRRLMLQPAETTAGTAARAAG